MSIFANSYLRMASTLAIGAVGGALAKLIGIPLPWLIGSQIILCFAAIANIKIAGGPLQWPIGSRLVFLPVIGVMIGASFTLDVIARMTEWWPSLIIISVFLVLVQAIVYRLFKTIGGLDAPTAYFAAFPGGLVEAAILGQKAGGDQKLISLQHFLRVTLIVLLIPLLFWVASGTQVGSSAGMFIGEKEIVSVSEAALLMLAAIVGTLLGRKIRLPAPDIFGAVIASAILYLLGWVHGRVPLFLIELTQLVIGTSLGVGFVGITLRQLGRSAGLAVGAFLIVSSSAVLVAWTISLVLGIEPRAMLLAIIPGGLAEMSLVTLSLGLSVPFVTSMHLFRIFFTVMILPLGYRWLVDQSD